MYLKSFYLIFVLLYLSSNSFSQQIFEIYLDQKKKYSDKSKFEPEQFDIWGYTFLKDSLPDGVYLFYNVPQDKMNLKKKNVILQVEYVNGMKNGRMTTMLTDTSYLQVKAGNHKLGSYRHICDYKNGVRHGVEVFMHTHKRSNTVTLKYYQEYKKGKRHGLEIYLDYRNFTINKWENDTLKEVLVDDFFFLKKKVRINSIFNKYTHTCDYKKKVKHGVELIIQSRKRTGEITIYYYQEYKEGEKHGLEFFYDPDNATFTVNLWKKGMLKEILVDRFHFYPPFPAK